MIYIKHFEAFDVKKENQPLEITADMNNFNDTEKWIKEFNSKKSQLLQIYMSYKNDTQTDLYNKLLSAKFIKPSNANNKLAFINPLFTVYSEYCQKNRDIKNIQISITQKQKELTDKQSAMSSGDGDKEVLKKDIENAQKDITDLNTQLNDIKKNISDLQKTSTKQIQDKTKELQLAKNRIDNVKQE